MNREMGFPCEARVSDICYNLPMIRGELAI